MSFVPNTDAQRAEMLAALGKSKSARCTVHDMDDLFSGIPPDSARGRSISRRADRNWRSGRRSRSSPQRIAISSSPSSAAGSTITSSRPPWTAILSRSEFYTAYTPYQPEASQGTLQAIYEFQSAVSRLTGMEAANASLYDGGTALYEAAMMALRVTGRRKIILDEAVNPIYRKMLRSYTTNLEIEFREFPSRDGRSDRERIAEHLDDRTAGVIVQNPTFFGCVDDYSDIAQMAHKAGALLIVSCYPISLGILKTPGEMDADIATAEGQSLGLPLSFGGPYLGLMATRRKFVRKMPGRLVGRTVDKAGRPGFVLTLQAREQHVRRAKATSNICTNESLCALGALVYLTLLGKTGLTEAAHLCAAKAAYARRAAPRHSRRHSPVRRADLQRVRRGPPVARRPRHQRPDRARLRRRLPAQPLLSRHG